MAKNKQEDLDSIRSYYDHNTPRFLSYGAQRRTRTIHRPVWGDGVQNEKQALHFVHNLLLGELRTFQNNEVSTLDLGCGVGASLFYLADNLGGIFKGIGLTISPVQAKIALREQRRMDPQKRCKFLVGDFLNPPLINQFDLVFSIEAFAHTSRPAEYFKYAAKLLKPGGRLVLCDDFHSIKGSGGNLNPRKNKWLRIFKDGWGVRGIWTPDCVETLAREEELILTNNFDLTSCLHQKPLPSSIIELLSAIIGTFPGKNQYLQSVIGGQALQLCLEHGVVEYRYLVFEKISL